MIKYWRIGTGAETYVNKFALLNKKTYIGDKIHLIKDGNVLQVINQSKEVLGEYNSLSTVKQYLKVWEAFGFITKTKENTYLISTPLTSKEELKELSIIFLKKKSADKKIASYRFSIIVNILVQAKLVNEIEISNKISQTKKELSITSIKKAISNYEREMVKNKKIIRELKEIYDKQF